MLEEVISGARREGALSRRWYTGPHFDLFVWRESVHEIVQFQLFWKRPPTIHDADHIPEEAITWSRDGGIQMAQVAEADRYRAPILNEHSEIDLTEMTEAFKQHAVPSNYPDVHFVMAKLSNIRP